MTVKAADCAAPTKLIQVVSDSGAGYRFNVNACNFLKIDHKYTFSLCNIAWCRHNFLFLFFITCMMYHMDQVMQLATVRIEPFNQFSWMADFP